MSTKDERRAMLLEAARTVVMRFGYRKATFEDIAAEARVSRATLYNYFESKEEIFRTIVAQEMDAYREVLVSAVNPSDLPDVQMLDYVRARFRRLAELRAIYAAVLDAARDVMVMMMAEFRTFHDEQVAFFEARIREGIASGRFRRVDAHLLATSILAALRGMDEAMFLEEGSANDDAAECLLTTLFGGLVLQGGDP